MKTAFLNALGLGLLGLLSACVYREPQPRPAYYSAPPQVYNPPPVQSPVYPPPAAPSNYEPPPDWEVSASFEIDSEADFHEPLAPYGGWVEVESYGRCWRPAPGRLSAGWNPYSDGHWVWTDCGWYWVSDEPWAWACYHYGSWVRHPSYAWIWVPGTEWAPAWVTWRMGGSYVGWAPAPPRRLVARAPAPQFVFVQTSRFHEPVRPQTVIVNNTTIINQTTVINNVRQETRTFGSAGTRRVTVNEGPGLAPIERAAGRKMRSVRVQDAVRETPIPTPVRQQIFEQKGKRRSSPDRAQSQATPQPTLQPGPTPQVTPAPAPSRAAEATPAPEPRRDNIQKRGQPETTDKGKAKDDDTQRGRGRPATPEQPQVTPQPTLQPTPTPSVTPAPAPVRAPGATPTPEPRRDESPKRGQPPETRGKGKAKDDDEQRGSGRASTPQQPQPTPQRTLQPNPTPQARPTPPPGRSTEVKPVLEPRWDKYPKRGQPDTRGKGKPDKTQPEEPKGKGKGNAKGKGKAPEEEKDDSTGKP